MHFRFCVAVSLVVVIALTGISIEKENLSLKRQISLQEYRLQQLQETRAQSRVRLERLTSPVQVLASAIEDTPEPFQVQDAKTTDDQSSQSAGLDGNFSPR